MNIFKGMLVFLLVVLVGVVLASNLSEDKSNEIIKNQLSFGDSNSKVHVYLFTDWLCPYCKKLEPNLQNIIPSVSKVAQVTFVDVAIHPESANFIPYNVSFMMNNKQQYLALRSALDELSTNTKTPTEKEVTDAIQKTGVVYKKLNNSQILDAANYFMSLMQKFKVDGTPAIVVENEKTNKFEVISGVDNMTEENILKTIEKVR